MDDSILHQGQRKLMVTQLAQQFAFDSAVLHALESVPRHLFIDKGLWHLAYKDRPLPIAAKQTISQPFTVAMQTHLLGCNRWDKVLEIGTGCGYQCAVLMAMGFKVYSIERIRALYLQAKKNLMAAGYPPEAVLYGDGFAGNQLFAPYQGILVTCGAPQIPQTLLQQLAIGGKLVIPVGEQNQQMARVTRLAEQKYITETFGDYQFVPMLTGTQ